MNSANHKRLIFWSVPAAILLLGIGYSLWPQPLVVDLVTVEPGELQVTVDEEGKTRVRDVYVLSAPVTGHLRRIQVDVGDSVSFTQTVIAEIEPIDPDFLDPRSEAQAEADIRAAQSAEALARAEVSEAQAELTFADTEVKRARELLRNKTISQRDVDDAERRFKTRRAALAKAQAALQVRNYELERAQALLMSPRDTQTAHHQCECILLKAPVDGRILHKYHESEGVVAAGEPLLTLGDPKDLEIIVELHSSQAVKVEPGQVVIIENWGGDSALEGRVRHVEPVGFTKVSALGIEEQRVNVIIDLTSPYQVWHRLGHGYQLDVRIVLWQHDAVITLPLTALFRDADNWAIFVDNNGTAQKRYVTLGHKNDLQAQVVNGVQAGESVLMYPSDRVADGVAVTARMY